jgi:Protein of unknown function (DUF2800)
MNTPITEPDRGQWTSASNAQADSLCPGRYLAQKGIPEVQTEAAEHGRIIHEALKKQDPAGLTVEQVDTYNACNEIDRRALLKFFGPDIDTSPPTIEREKRFWVQWPDGLKHSGQVDAVYRKGVQALIVEYKALSGDVPDSSRNLQLRDQACLYYSNSQLIKEIGTMVNQPMVTHEPEICLYSEEHIFRSRNEMYFRVKASNEEAGKRIPGEAQCKFCLAASSATCKEYLKWASEMVVEDNRLVIAIQEKRVADWDPRMRAEFCERLTIAQKWLDDMKGEIKRILKEDPGSIPGWELRKGAAINDLINPQQIFDAFAEKGGTLEQFMECMDISNVRLREKIAIVTRTNGKGLKAEYDSIVGNNVMVSEKEPSLRRKKKSA